ncbi:MAG: hypothetical protein FWG44_00600 [Oscillospiraceae bacterium]|nr:hypothetical protein [Oscillospiraceae bacterium]
MQAYSAYYEKGHIIPVGNFNIPERRKLIITVLDEYVPEVKIDDITLASQQSLSKDWLLPEEDEAWADL